MRNSVFLAVIALVLHFYCFQGVLYANDDLAIKTIILEAQGESLDGQIAVGEVIRNRVKSMRYPNTIESVVTQPFQFSCWNNKDLADRYLSGISGEVWQKASRAWYESEFSDLTKGSLHYHAKYISPYWVKGKKPVKEIGLHLFYNNIK